jgi:hypothetical protein
MRGYFVPNRLCFESLERCYPPGLVGVHTGRSQNRQPLSFAFWLQRVIPITEKCFGISLISLVSTYDGSDTTSSEDALLMDSWLAGIPP